MCRSKKLLIHCFLCFLCFYVENTFYAESTDGLSDSRKKEEKTWTLAAVPFKFTNEIMTDEASAAVAENIPKLILEQVYAGASRTPSAREMLSRDADSLRTERLSLFLQLSKAEKDRDALILRDLSDYKFKKEVVKKEKEIDELHVKITENLVKSDRISERYYSDMLSEDFFWALPAGRREFFTAPSEKIELYENDASKLFSAPKEAVPNDFTDYKFESAVNSANIRGLISGTISSYGGYAAVTAELHLYPGGVSGGTVTEVGLLSSPLQIARNLSRALMPFIANNPPVILNISVEPEQAASKVSVSLDGIVFPKLPKSIVAERGIHMLSFEAEGFRNASVTYSFSEKSSYNISVNMARVDPKVVEIDLLNPVAGVLSTEAVRELVVESPVAHARIEIDDGAVIGHFTGENGISSFFYIPEDILREDREKDKNITVPVIDYDVSANIEKRRRRMYTAYSAFIVSLPFTFYNYGTYINKLNRQDVIDAYEIERWRSRSLACVGVSVSLGAVFGYQLVRYLYSANAVLPKTAKIKNDAKTADARDKRNGTEQK
ncbi:hypothetical protein HRQ91_04425 [Treponema parvum]|uniref:PEGA domain-containing protein n=1 Tax=Treponema parvum TaxID=138851 RepID=A0A975F3M5_9SPIR|nr:hypothetical protein [Treponema parvum]QTQ13761.1 hypothetical protein HRQ91_04425 [Treponema parvum]